MFILIAPTNILVLAPLGRAEHVALTTASATALQNYVKVAFHFHIFLVLIVLDLLLKNL